MTWSNTRVSCKWIKYNSRIFFDSKLRPWIVHFLVVRNGNVGRWAQIRRDVSCQLAKPEQFQTRRGTWYQVWRQRTSTYTTSKALRYPRKTKLTQTLNKLLGIDYRLIHQRNNSQDKCCSEYAYLIFFKNNKEIDFTFWPELDQQKNQQFTQWQHNKCSTILIYAISSLNTPVSAECWIVLVPHAALLFSSWANIAADQNTELGKLRT